jgi:hypothetical protein
MATEFYGRNAFCLSSNTLTVSSNSFYPNKQQVKTIDDGGTPSPQRNDISHSPFTPSNRRRRLHAKPAQTQHRPISSSFKWFISAEVAVVSVGGQQWGCETVTWGSLASISPWCTRSSARTRTIDNQEHGTIILRGISSTKRNQSGNCQGAIV